jgi:zinc protease
MRPLVLLGCFVACTPLPPSQAVIVSVPNFAVGETRLASGLYVVVEVDPDAGAVSSAVVVGAGAADDPPEQDGLAHLVEHLAFRSHAPGGPSLASRMALEGIGEWQAVTSMDTTVYYQVGAPQSLESMLQADIARMAAPLQGLDAKEFAAERGVVINEILGRDETGTWTRARGALFQQLFAAGTPYSRSTGGTVESVSRLTLEDAQAWVAQHYRPPALTWVIAGDFDAAAVAKLLEKLVPSGLSDGHTPSANPAATMVSPIANISPAPLPTPQVAVPIDHRQLMVGWRLPPARDRVEAVLASLPSFVAERAWMLPGVENAHADIVPLKQASVLVLSVDLKSDADAESVFARLQRDWSDFWREGSQTQMWWIDRAFVQIRAAAMVSLARANESIANRTEYRALTSHLSQSSHALERKYAAIAGLTYKEILDTGRTYINGELARAVVLVPSDPTIPQVDLAEPSAFAPTSVRAEYPDEVVAAFARGPGLGTTLSFTASNGLQVLVPPSKRTGLVTVTLALSGGRRTSRPPGLSDRLRWSVASESYGSPESLGAGSSEWWTDDTGNLRYRASAGNLPNVLAILAQRLITWRVVDVPKSVLAAPPKADATASFDKLFWRSLVGEAAGPWALSRTEAAAFGRSEAQAWLDEVLNPRRSLLIIAGDVRGPVEEQVEHWLGRWKGPPRTEVASLPARPQALGVLRVLKSTLPKAKQVFVRFGCVAEGKSLEDEIAFKLLAKYLEEQWTTLERETLGSSYGFSSLTVDHRDGSMELVVTGRVENKSIQRMAVAVEQAWRALPQLGMAKVQRLRWEFAREYSVSFLTSAALSSAIVDQWNRGRPPAALDEMPQALLRVGLPEMAGVGAQCQASAILGLLGDSAALNVETQLLGAQLVLARTAPAH